MGREDVVALTAQNLMMEVWLITRFLASLLAFTLLLSGAAMAASPSKPAAVTVQHTLTSYGPAPNGLVAVIKDVPDASLDLRALSNPYISGVALQIHWSDVEPVAGKPDWSKLDALFAAADSSHKWVQLFVFPGFFSPAWALDGVRTDRFPIQYGPGAGTVMTLPMPWDRVYLNRWFAFLKLLNDRYGASPAFRVMAADGPTSVFDETTLPRSPQDLRKFQTQGYTPSKYVAAWRQTFRVFAADFPNQYVSLSVGREVDILDINDQGKIDRIGASRARQEIVNEAITLLGPRFALEMNAVHAGPDPYPHGSNSQAYDEFIIGYNGRIITGFQMGGGMEGAIGSRKMGAPGNPPLALRRSIDLAMERNSAGRHVNYVEIYEPDVFPAAMQSVLRYGASLFAP
ncbi:MAG TPA: hypothetical protein VKZ50_07190 [bacterium]|nr:hypothetical protein [bacterium]